MFARLVGVSLVNGIPGELIHINGMNLINRAITFLSSFANANLEQLSSLSLVAENVRLIIPAFSTMSDGICSPFEGAYNIKEASLRFGGYIRRILSNIIPTKLGFAAAFHAQINRKPNVSADLTSLCAPFVLISTNLCKCGLQQEMTMHGMIRIEQNSSNQLTLIKLYLDANQLNSFINKVSMGEAKYTPL